MVRRSRRTRNKPPEIVPVKSDEDQQLQDDSDTGEQGTGADDDDNDNVQEASGDDGENEEPVAPDAVRGGRRSQRGRRPNARSESVSPANASPSGKGRGRGGGSTSAPASEDLDDSVAVRTSDPLGNKGSGKKAVKKQEQEDGEDSANTNVDEESDAGDDPPKEALGTEDPSPVPAPAVAADKVKTRRGGSVVGTVGDKRGGRKSEPFKPLHKDGPAKGRKSSDLATLAKSNLAPLTGGDTASVTDETVEQQKDESVSVNDQNNETSEGTKRPGRKRKLTAKAAAAAIASEDVDESTDAAMKKGRHNDNGESLEIVQGVKKKGNSGESEASADRKGYPSDEGDHDTKSFDAPNVTKELSDQESKEAEKLNATEEDVLYDKTKSGPAILTASGPKNMEMARKERTKATATYEKEDRAATDTAPKSSQHAAVEQTISTKSFEDQVSGSGSTPPIEEAENFKDSQLTETQDDTSGCKTASPSEKDGVQPSISNMSTPIGTGNNQSLTSPKTSVVSDELVGATSTSTNPLSKGEPSIEKTEIIPKPEVSVDKQKAGSKKSVTLSTFNGSKETSAIVDNLAAGMKQEITPLKGTTKNNEDKSPLPSNDGIDSVPGNSRSEVILEATLGDDEFSQNQSHQKEDESETTTELSMSKGSLLATKPAKEMESAGAKGQNHPETEISDVDIKHGNSGPSKSLTKGHSLEQGGEISRLEVSKIEDFGSIKASHAEERGSLGESSKYKLQNDTSKAGVADSLHPIMLSVDIAVSKIDTETSTYISMIADQKLGEHHKPQPPSGDSDINRSTHSTNSAQTAQLTDLPAITHTINSSKASIISSEIQRDRSLKEANSSDETDFGQENVGKSISKSADVILTSISASRLPSSVIDSDFKGIPQSSSVEPSKLTLEIHVSTNHTDTVEEPESKRESPIPEVARLVAHSNNPDDGGMIIDAEMDDNGIAINPSILSKSKNEQTGLPEASRVLNLDETTAALVGASNVEVTAATTTGDSSTEEQVAMKEKVEAQEALLAQAQNVVKTDESVDIINVDVDSEKKNVVQRVGLVNRKSTESYTEDLSTPKSEVHQEQRAQCDVISTGKVARSEINDSTISVDSSMPLELRESRAGEPEEVLVNSSVHAIMVLSSPKNLESENDAVVISSTHLAALNGFPSTNDTTVVDRAVTQIVEAQLVGADLSLKNHHEAGEEASGVDNHAEPKELNREVDHKVVDEQPTVGVVTPLGGNFKEELSPSSIPKDLGNREVSNESTSNTPQGSDGSDPGIKIPSKESDLHNLSSGVDIEKIDENEDLDQDRASRIDTHSAVGIALSSSVSLTKIDPESQNEPCGNTIALPENSATKFGEDSGTACKEGSTGPNTCEDRQSMSPSRKAAQPDTEMSSPSAMNMPQGVSADQRSDTSGLSFVDRKRTLEEANVEDAPEEVPSPAQKRPRAAWVTLSRMRRKAVTVDECSSFSAYDMNKVTRVRIHLFNAGSKVHRGKGFERLFSTYWDAVCLRLSDRLSSHTSERCDEAIDSFLMSRKLRQIHNRFIMSIMKRATRVFVPYSDILDHIPHKWRGRVKVKIIEPIVTPNAVEDSTPRAQSTSFIIAEVPHVDLEDPYKQTWDFVSDDSDSLRDVVEPIGIESTSPCIPGAIVIDPLLREAAETRGLKVTNNAVWILVVALREHTRNVLKNSMVLKKALESGQVYPPALHYPNVLAFSSKKDGKPHEKPLAPIKPSGPKRLINSMDILAAATRLPSGQIGSFGGSVSRLSLEQSFQTAFNSIPSCMAETRFKYVQNFVSDELLSIARNRKFDPSQRPVDSSTSARTHPKSHVPSDQQNNAPYPQSASHDPRNPGYMLAGSTVGVQPHSIVAPVPTSSQSTLSIQANRSILGDSTPSGPNHSSANSISVVAASEYGVPFGQLATVRPEGEDTRRASSATSTAQYLVPLVSSAPSSMSNAQTAALIAPTPISFHPPVITDVNNASVQQNSDALHGAPLLTSSQQGQVKQDIPHSEPSRSSVQRPVVRGMGRGAKDLASLMSRAATATTTTTIATSTISSTNPLSNEISQQQQPVASTTSLPYANPTNNRSEENDSTVGVSGGSGGNTNTDSEKGSVVDGGSNDGDGGKSSTSSGVSTVAPSSGEMGVRGKGFGTKDLAVMRARAAGGSPNVDRTPSGSDGGGEDPQQQRTNDTTNTSMNGDGGGSEGDTTSNSAK